MQPAVIAGFVRSPFDHARTGALATIRSDDLAASVIIELASRSGVDPASLDDVVLGCARPEGAQGNNIARVAGLLARLPVEVGGVTISRLGASSMSAIAFAAGQIALGAGAAYVCGGVETATEPLCVDLGGAPNPRVLEAYTAIGETAENIAARYGVSRGEQDRYALSSQMKAAAAQAGGRLAEEIVAVRTRLGPISEDGCLQPQTSLASLAALAPRFRADGSVTSGTIAPLADGAAATLLTSADFAQSNGLLALARIRAIAVAGCPPDIMGMATVPAARKALAIADLDLDDIDVFEIGEAFASQMVACLDELGLAWDRVNRDGGALALGHALGASGARITAKAAQLLGRERGRFALAVQPASGGQAVGIVLEAV
jgi:acetyl-CoA acyltransferase